MSTIIEDQPEITILQVGYNDIIRGKINDIKMGKKYQSTLQMIYEIFIIGCQRYNYFFGFREKLV